MIGSIQLGLSFIYSTSSILSILDCSRYSINIRLSKLDEIVVSPESVLTRAFFILKMWEISKYFKADKRYFTFWRYFIIIGSRALNSSLTYSMINCESMKIFKLSMSSSLIIFKPVKRASYSVWLFEILKLNRRTYSVTIPSKLMRMRLAPLSWALDAPSTCNTHIDTKSA